MLLKITLGQHKPPYLALPKWQVDCTLAVSRDQKLKYFKFQVTKFYCGGQHSCTFEKLNV